MGVVHLYGFDSGLPCYVGCLWLLTNYFSCISINSPGTEVGTRNFSDIVHVKILYALQINQVVIRVFF